MRGILRGLVLLGLVLVAACLNPQPVNPQAVNRPMEVNVPPLDIVSPRHLVAKKVPRELLLVLDPARVPDEYVIPQGEILQTNVHGLQTFVTRDLARTLGAYFERVTVVRPGFAAPAHAYAVADVSIDSLRIAVIKVASVPDSSRQAAQVLGEMTWAVAIRLGEDDDYVYSFAGVSQGAYSITKGADTQEAFRSLFEIALTGLIESYVGKDVHNVIKARSVGAAGE